tara:strand:+ start:198 stop:512 length:315 start_codon:yes stop_codon:yes gene_type:complete
MPGRLNIIRVEGSSMAPLFHSGDYVVLDAIDNINELSERDVVVVNHETLGLIIKQVSKVKGSDLKLTGISPRSIDGNHLGWVADDQIVGRVTLRISQDEIAHVT